MLMYKALTSSKLARRGLKCYVINIRISWIIVVGWYWVYKDNLEGIQVTWKDAVKALFTVGECFGCNLATQRRFLIGDSSL